MDVVVDIAVALIAVAALIVTILANRNASRSADASQDSAREAERSAEAAERQAAAAAAALPPPPPAVAWKAELRSTARKGKGATFVLRNVGTSTATGVQVVVPPARDGLVRPELGNGEVPARGSFQVVVLGIDELPDLHELLIAWDGRDELVQVSFCTASRTSRAVDSAACLACSGRTVA
jgi:hypothetical protein